MVICRLVCAAVISINMCMYFYIMTYQNSRPAPSSKVFKFLQSKTTVVGSSSRSSNASLNTIQTTLDSSSSSSSHNKKVIINILATTILYILQCTYTYIFHLFIFLIALVRDANVNVGMLHYTNIWSSV